MNHRNATQLVWSPGLSAAVGLIAPGAVQSWQGRRHLGRLMMLFPLILGLVMTLATVFGGGRSILVTFGICLVGWLVLHLVSAASAWRLGALTRERRPRMWLSVVVGLAVYPIILLVLLRGQVLGAFVFVGRSMQPTLQEGDRLLVNRLARTPERGQLVVFRSALTEGRSWIKRVVALPGDRVAVRSGRLILNGEPRTGQVRDGRARESVDGRVYQVWGLTEVADFEAMLVPDAMVFVLGDHRDQSRDSRHF
ncbi:MAG: signal peptidase I, partial [Planctomycetes bacterium]|nr:signal peptidase I [Planctomycetota bacterium]